MAQHESEIQALRAEAEARLALQVNVAHQAECEAAKRNLQSARPTRRVCALAAERIGEKID